MQKRFVILAAVIGVLVSVILTMALPGPGPAPSVAVRFAGFTNSGGRAEALFAISNPPNAAISLHSVSGKDVNSSSFTSTERGYFSWAHRDVEGLAYAIGVDTTNEPLRVVFQLQLPAVGPRRMLERIIELWAEIQGNERTHFTGRRFFVTNETTLVNAPP